MPASYYKEIDADANGVVDGSWTYHNAATALEVAVRSGGNASGSNKYASITSPAGGELFSFLFVVSDFSEIDQLDDFRLNCRYRGEVFAHPDYLKFSIDGVVFGSAFGSASGSGNDKESDPIDPATYFPLFEARNFGVKLQSAGYDSRIIDLWMEVFGSSSTANMSPTSGGIGTVVTITGGSYLVQDDATVLINGTPVDPGDVTVLSSSSLEFIVPDLGPTPGLMQVVISTNFGNSGLNSSIIFYNGGVGTPGPDGFLYAGSGPQTFDEEITCAATAAMTPLGTTSMSIDTPAFTASTTYALTGSGTTIAPSITLPATATLGSAVVAASAIDINMPDVWKLQRLDMKRRKEEHK